MTNPPSILIVDDMASNLLLLGSILEKSGFAVQAAMSGPDALEISTSSPPPSLILLDIRMPDMDGLEVCRRLKADPSTARIPVIFVTALGSISEKLAGFREGAVDFITKPFEPEEVLARVRIHLQLTRIESLAIEVEEHKKSEQALLETQAQLKRAQRLAHLGSWRWHIQEDRLEWSDEMFSIFGIDPATFTGSLVDIIHNSIHPDDRPIVDRANLSVSQSGAPAAKEYRIVHPDGTIRHVRAEPGELVLDPSGAPLHLSGIALDITQQKIDEEDRIQIESRLADSRKLESLGRLAGGVAHDFNNMLGVIMGHADIALRQGPACPRIVEDLQAILKAARRSAELTRQLLTFARRDTVSPRTLRLDESIAGIVDLLRRVLGERIELNWTPGAGLSKIRIDPSQLEQILTNICLNARDAIADAGSISIETSILPPTETPSADPRESPQASHTAISIADTGCGMDEETLSRVFDPFFTTKPHGKATGLGLSTVLGAVQQNGGRIEASSKPGLGSTFRIVFPCCQEELSPAPVPTASHTGDHAASTILLVEDNPDVLAMTRKILELQHFTVLATSNPWEALDLVRSHKESIRLLLTDVIMPGINGRQLVAQAEQEVPGLRHIYCSGYPADIIANHGILTEGLDFIQKPFSIQDLLHKIREVLDRP